MNERWALVTGSSRGLGLEIALAMAGAGFRVVITGRNPEALALAMGKLEAVSAIGHQAVCLDLAEEDSPVKLQARLNQLGVSVSVIVNNLGGGVPGDRRNIPTDILRASMRLNLEVGIEINNLLYEDLKVNKGIIVHIGSTASLHFDAPPGYVISKTALNAYVKNAAMTFAKEGVCIFAVLPGILDHEGSYINKLQRSNTERYGKFLSESVFGRFTTSTEVARFIVKIIEARTPMINGALIQFDGGKD
jgi:NAD(P)-dependent dehydrogenase (short-subunit alcohol dehydrogenase family)